MTTSTAARTATVRTATQDDLLEHVARPLLADLQQAWNDGDGAAFGAPFTDEAVFVDVRGDRHLGGRPAVAAGHEAILASIYRGSRVRYEAALVQQVAQDVVLVHADAVLEAPTGPLTGTHRSTITLVAARRGDRWAVETFHNTLVAG